MMKIEVQGEIQGQEELPGPGPDRQEAGQREAGQRELDQQEEKEGGQQGGGQAQDRHQAE